MPLFAALPAAGGGDFDVRSPEFRKILAPDSKVGKLAGGMHFTEGPVWVEKERCLLFSDIPANQVKRWSKDQGLSTWLEPSHHANGHTLDRQGNLISCEHSARRVTWMNLGTKRTVKVLASEFQGKKLNSPNDAVVKSDGTIWFTDPPYGVDAKLIKQPKNYVFRLDPKTGKLTAVADDFGMPNGLCFSPDEKKLYIADSSDRRHVRVFDVTEDHRLVNGRVLATIPKGLPDGIRADTDGRIYVTGEEGVYVYSPSGELLGTILVPESPANCTFGDEGRHTLFITARTSLYAIRLAATGAQQP
jgi:gluconolactonase